MGWYDKILRALRRRKRSILLKSQNPTADQVRAAVEEIIGCARKDEKAGVRKDRWLFRFESDLEEIADAITYLRDAGDKEAYRELYEKLYLFAEETMKDSYMPLLLYILYRYANACMETDRPQEAAELFEELYSATDRLIGTKNPYGITCLEGIANSAANCGRKEKAEAALHEMQEIAGAEFGPHSAMALAAAHFAARIRKENAHGDCIQTDYSIQ